MNYNTSDKKLLHLINELQDELDYLTKVANIASRLIIIDPIERPSEYYKIHGDLCRLLLIAGPIPVKVQE